MSDKSRFPDLDFARMLAGLKLPGLDLDAVLAAQRRNIEAMQAANRVATENMAAILERQAQMLREGVQQIAASVQAMAGQPGAEAMRKQGEMAQAALEKALANMRELAEMAAKSNREVFDVVNARARQAMEELRQTLAGQQGRE